jgi:hypothetical protein
MTVSKYLNCKIYKCEKVLIDEKREIRGASFHYSAIKMWRLMPVTLCVLDGVLTTGRTVLFLLWSHGVTLTIFFSPEPVTKR